jgi:hypothetical protein
MILLSTNDRYWPLDALKLYWSELPAPKTCAVRAEPGHGLRDAERVIGSVSAVHRYAAAGKPMPETTWSFGSTPGELKVQVKADREARKVLVWSAQSSDEGFSRAKWTARQCAKEQRGICVLGAAGRRDIRRRLQETSFQDEGALPFSTDDDDLHCEAGDAARLGATRVAADACVSLQSPTVTVSRRSGVACRAGGRRQPPPVKRQILRGNHVR